MCIVKWTVVHGVASYYIVILQCRHLSMYVDMYVCLSLNNTRATTPLLKMILGF